MNDRTPPGGPEVAARKPPKIAEATVKSGETKAARSVGQLIVLGILAGAYIGFGGMFSFVAGAGAEGVLSYGMAQVVGGLVFSLGLILVILGGAELFTGNTLMLMTVAEERIDWPDLLRSWSIVWVANFVGSLLLAVFALWAGFHSQGDGAVGASALDTALTKASLPFMTALASGILANILVVLAVWLAAGGRTTADKLLAIVLPIAAFVAMGLEHSVANMFQIPYGLMVQAFAEPSFWTEAKLDPAGFSGLTLGGAASNIVAATIGNVIGGGAIGLAYWFAFLRDD